MAVTIDDSRIIAYVEADLTRGTVSPRQVVCTQYDAEMRVIAVRLKQNGKDWEIPAGYSVNVRMRKADGTSVYNPQQGAGNVAYVTLSAQMCGVEGVQKFVVEIVSGSDVAQTVPIELRVIKNPIEDQDFTSEDEKETIQQAVKDAQDAAEESQENANQAYTWNQNCITIYHQTENLKNDTQTLHDQAQTAATTAQEMAAQVEDYAEKVLGISVPAVALSQSEYDALNPPDPKTIYIVESDGPQNSLVANYPLTQNLSDGMDGSKTATAIGCQGLGNWDGTGPSFNTAPVSGAVGQHQNYITLPSNLLSGMSFSDGITLAMDLKPNATAAGGNGDWTRLINLYKHSNSPTGTAEGELYLTQGLIATAYYDGVTAQYLDASKAGLITAGAWHTVAVVLSATELIVYLDGTRIGSVNNTGNLLEQLPYMDTNEIGNSRFADKDFSGLLRNFRIYDKAMSAAEIGQLNQASTWKLYYGAAQDSTLAQLQEAVDTLTESVSTAQEDIQKAQEDISALQSAMEKIEDGTTELPYLKTSGGTMTGDVDMDGNAITGLPDPAEDSDAIPKGWADGRYNPITAAIRPTVTGNPIHVEDSAEAPVQGLCVYGRTEQVTTTGAQLWNGGDFTFSVAGSETGFGYAPDALANAIKGLPEGTYSVSYTPKGSGTLGTDAGKIAFYPSKNSSPILQPTSTFELNQELKEQIALVSVYGYLNQENSVSDFMLNTGSTAAPWEPYTGGKPSPSPEYPQELMSAGDDGQIDVTVCGANLLDLRNGKESGTAKDQDVEYTAVGDGSYTRKGVPTMGIQNFWIAGDFNKDPADPETEILFELPPGTYTVKDCILFEKASSFKDTFTIERNTFITAVRAPSISSTGTEVDDIIYPMLNAGSTAIPWQPYTGQPLTLTGDLPGIPVDSGGNYTDPDGQQWVCNYRDWARGVDVQMVAQETLSGVPAFEETSDLPGRFFWNNALSNTYKDGGSKSLLNFAQWVPWSNPGTNTRGATNVKHVLFSPAETMTEEEVNALFVTMIASDAPPTVIGQLETPIETPIPAEELAAYKALQTYDGTINVTATDGAGISLRYIADTQKYIDNKIAALSAAMLEG